MSRDGDHVPMRFVDFALRGWRDGRYAQVLAHATPAGTMRQPAATRLGVFAADDYRLPLDAPLSAAAARGRELARILLPPEVWGLLIESLRLIRSRPEIGLRIRLCLDDDLIDLPWEYLYGPDVDAATARSGFLLADDRISLIREPASIVAPATPDDRVKRGVFVGAMFDDGSDEWQVEDEYASLAKALRPVKSLLSLDFLPAEASARVGEFLERGCGLFHYSGHVDIADGGGAMVQLADREIVGAADLSAPKPPRVEALDARASWASSAGLAPLLLRAGTRLAFFNACQSGYWSFVRPLMRAGIPAVIGVQGLVGTSTALGFAEKLYRSLAVGLSLDEAITFARLWAFDPAHAQYECDWGRFMAYMPSDAPVLFPRSERGAMQRRQQDTRAARRKTIRNTQAASKKEGDAWLYQASRAAGRAVLLLGRFTEEGKAVLDAIDGALSKNPQYRPRLFDFDKPAAFDLIESIDLLAAASRFVIADLSNPRSVPAELQRIVPAHPLLPVVLLIDDSQQPYPVVEHVRQFRSVVRSIVRYRDVAHLLSILEREVVAPAEALYRELRPNVEQ